MGKSTKNTARGNVKTGAVTEESLTNMLLHAPEWIHDEEEMDDIILSTRIRLARNLKGLSFPNRGKKDMLEKVVSEVNDAIQKTRVLQHAMTLQKSDLTPIHRKAFVERRLMSPVFAESRHVGVLAFENNELLSMMVNEEDHLRLQSVQPGLSLQEAWRQISRLDDELSDCLEFAFSPQFGYLTSCPTNVGTGMRASILVHLPALSLLNEIDEAIKKLAPSEIAVRGFYGEGTDVVGNIFQVSNQLTLGRTETSLVNRLEVVADKFVELERSARDRLLTRQQFEIEDRVYRSLAIMQSARLMSSNEFMRHLSNLLMGIDLQLITSINRQELKKLMIFTQPAHMQLVHHTNSDVQSRDALRAQIVREKLTMNS